MGNSFEQSSAVTSNETKPDRMQHGLSGGDHLQNIMNEVEQARQPGGGGFRAGDTTHTNPSSGSEHLPSLDLFDGSSGAEAKPASSSPMSAGAGGSERAPAGSSERSTNALNPTSQASGEAQVGPTSDLRPASSQTGPVPVR
jgi:hypothetical protein